MDGADLELFERSLRHATEHAGGAALDAALAELGWPDALAIDRRAAVSILFELQGAANVTSSALDRVVLSGLGLKAPAVVLPALGEWRSPGELNEGRIRVHGLASAAFNTSETALVVGTTGGADVAVAVATAGLSIRAVHGIDPWLGLVAVTGETTAAEPQPADWQNAVALGQLAIGHELVGAARKMLELACQHALERIQFGQPIGAFQAVRHRLADTLVAIETADAVLATAWEDPSPHSPAMAKALAGRGALTAARHCQQVLAGIGFTTEHPLHLFIRRTIVLDQLLGGGSQLTRQLGADILRSSTLPPAFPL